MCHEILIEKLKCMNFGDKAISMIKTYLQNRIQKVIIPSCPSDWIKLNQIVPQGTIMGPLLFNIFVNFMRSSVQRPTQLVQYADDTSLYSASGNLEQSIRDLETNIKNVILSFESHHLNINADKTEFMIFCEKSHNHIVDHRQLKVKNNFIGQSKSAKYLGVYLNQHLTYQMEEQNILRKMATGIKVLYSIRNTLPEKTCLLLLNSLVLSHLHYSSILINGILQNLRSTLEKQVSWAVKACYHKKKYDSSRDLKLQYKILPVGLFLDLKAVLFFWKCQNDLLPAFKHHEITTAKLKFSKGQIFWFMIQ